MKRIAYFDPIGHQGHAQDGHPERPERVEAIKGALQKTGHWQIGKKLQAASLSVDQLTNVHDRQYLNHLQEFSLRGDNFDAETYLRKKSWGLALQAAGGAIAVAEEVWARRAACGFALTRPPGHHATIGRAMGFCLINNVALAADHLINQCGAQRIAIVDLDVHHGNGTQDIFWERGNIFFASIHQSPLYPGTGHINEDGYGEGKGFSLNIPLPPYSGDEAYQQSLHEVILPKLTEYQPEMLLVSFGFDAHWRDPLANMQLSAEGYFQVMRKLTAFADEYCGGRIATMLEGGYDLEAGAACGLAITQAMLKEHFIDELGTAPYPERDGWQSQLKNIKKHWGL